MSPPDPALLAALDTNLVTHSSWIARRLPGMEVVDEDGLVLVDSGLVCDTFNFVSRAHLTDANVRAGVDRALRWFRSRGRPFSWWVGPADTPPDLGHILEQEGLEAAESELAMAAPLAGLPRVAVPEGLEVMRALTPGQIGDFAVINAANWSPPDPNVVEFYARATGLLADPACPLRLYVGYVHGRPVATSEVTLAGGVAGVYNVATLASWRRRGIASAVLRAALADAAAGGVDTAVLQAAPDGVGVYRRLGFVPFGHIQEYKPPAGWFTADPPDPPGSERDPRHVAIRGATAD